MITSICGYNKIVLNFFLLEDTVFTSGNISISKEYYSFRMLTEWYTFKTV